eukprot:Skav236269  [mRNA]  locus=scaffold2289:47277:70286:+ [translate_table: standard]
MAMESPPPAPGSAMQSVGEVMAIGRTFEAEPFTVARAAQLMLILDSHRWAVPDLGGGHLHGQETIQKALRMVDELSLGFDPIPSYLESGGSQELANPTPVRMWAIAKAFENGMGVEEVHGLTSIDKWFLSKLHGLHMIKSTMRSLDFYELRRNPTLLKEAKTRGFSDRQIAQLVTAPDTWAELDRVLDTEMSPALVPVDHGSQRYAGGPVTEAHIRHMRKKAALLPTRCWSLSMASETIAGIVPVVKQIDTLAAEYPAETNYLYLTYSGEEHDVDLAGSEKQCTELMMTEPWPPWHTCVANRTAVPVGYDDLTSEIPEPLTLHGEAAPSESCWEAESRIIVLGCGPYRIGSSVEFDWCSVSCVRTLRSAGHKAIVINCNSAEDSPSNPETVSTDFDESDRLYFEELSHDAWQLVERVMDISELENPRGVVISVGGQTPNNLAVGLHKCGVRILGTSVEAIDACYPVLVRPSYVLSGAAMRVVTNDDDLDLFLKTAAVVLGRSSGSEKQACKVPMFSFGRLKNSDPRLGVEMSSTGEAKTEFVNTGAAKQLQDMGFTLFATKSTHELPGLQRAHVMGGGMHGPGQRPWGFISAREVSGEQHRLDLELCHFNRTSRGVHSRRHVTKHGITCSLVYKPLIKREPNVLTMLQTGKIDMVIDVPDSMETWNNAEKLHADS